MIFDWEDPLANATPEQRGRAAARRRGGFVLLIIEYWPYILTIFGALWSFIYYSAFKKRS